MSTTGGVRASLAVFRVWLEHQRVVRETVGVETTARRVRHAASRTWDVLLGVTQAYLLYLLVLVGIGVALLMTSQLASVMAWVVSKTD